MINFQFYKWIFHLLQPSRDVSGAAIALFTASLHNPQVATHKTTLQGIVFQLDAALQSSDTQRNGLVFIYDMSGSKYSNFDYELSQKILTMLKVSENYLITAQFDIWIGHNKREEIKLILHCDGKVR